MPVQPAPGASADDFSGAPAEAEAPLALSERDAVTGAQRFRGMSREGIAEVIAQAIDGARIDLYLQPIVTLPQRKVRYYEALTRLRTEDGDIIPAGDFIEYAESFGLMPKIDNLLVFRCVQVTRRLQLKSRDVGVFCNVSAATLTDPLLFKQFLDFMDANRALSNALMFEFTQEAYRAFGPLEYESLAALAERGFRFSLDHVADLRMEPKELADRYFRFLKVPAKLLLNRASNAQSDIHPADLADLLARSGIDLIAERIESESMVVDLLDYDVRFGQGFLFSAPRPVRAEALQGAAAATDKPQAGVAPSEFAVAVGT
jgi:cyclic-di-GMP phosphodiesterase TipF (flagellum assembly factor)